MAGLILKDLHAPQHKLDEYSHEAAAGIIERYLKNPSYRIGSFYDVMKHACLDAISERSLNPSAGHKERPKTRAHTAWIDLNKVQVPFMTNDNLTEEDPLILEGLQSYFRHFKWYRPAIKGLIPYLPKRWMFDHAVQLKQIFLEARDGRGARLQSPNERTSEGPYQKASAGNNSQI